MKIGGPEGPGQVTPPAADLEPAAPDKANGPRFADVLEPAAPARSLEEASALAEVSAKLRAGEITAAQAAELIIDTIVRNRIATPELHERLRGVLRRLIEEDPILAAKLRTLAEENK